MKWLGRVVAFVLLTALTQVGGVLYAATLLPSRRVRTRAHRLALFVALYAAAWYPIGRLAALSGRRPLPCTEADDTPLRASPIACVLHRHYAKAGLADVATALARAEARAYPGTLTRTLDAGFPFADGFPLLPHLSHRDGRKLDLAFYYRDDGGYRRGALSSPLGYGRFEQPGPGDPQPCRGMASSRRWEMGWLAPFTRSGLSLDRDRTRFALRWLAGEGRRRGVTKVFVEPHLARRLGVSGAAIRFQGCRAARHDDHLHVEWAPP